MIAVAKIQEALKNPYEAKMEDFFHTASSEYDQFDQQCWNKGNGYSCPNFPEFERRIEGLEQGLYLFAGESNSGNCVLQNN